MKIHRFIGEFDMKPGMQTITDPDFCNQVRNVLKLRMGEEVILCDGRGHDAYGKIAQISAGVVRANIAEVRPNEAEPRRRVVLYCAILKSENFENACQKAVEAGVARIVPVISDRTIKKEVRMARLEKIAKEAAEQSGRGVVPDVVPAMAFEDALADSFPDSLNVFFDIDAPLIAEGDFAHAGSGPVGIFIGPEGGWTPQERNAAQSRGAMVRSLGARVLRGETAASVASFLASCLSA